MISNEELLYLHDRGLVIDLFAGGGGASTGFEQALGRHVDIALNHEGSAIALHAANHPRTHHVLQDIYAADPVKIIAGRPVFWIHASPSCTQHSRARRAIPAERQSREMGWRVLDFVDAGRPLVVTLENVAEWTRWSPLKPDGRPDRSREGETWRAYLQAFRDRGYEIEHKVLNAADYGAPTARHRLFVIARRDGLPILWPRPTHGPQGEHSWEAAHKFLDWSLPAPSIFTRSKPLAPATHNRILKGVRKFIVEASEPFLAPQGTAVGDGENRPDLVAAFLAQNHADLPGRSARLPLSTICTKAAGQGLVTASFIHVMRRNTVGIDLRSPLYTLCTGTHFAEVRVRGSSEGVGSNDNDGAPPFAFTIRGEAYHLQDIGFRFLTAAELWRLQGFPPSYITKVNAGGKPIGETKSKVLIGNSVCPPQARAVAEAVLQPIRELIDRRLVA